VFFDLHGETLTRASAIKLIEKYDGKCSDEYIRMFCDYIEIGEREFWDHVDKHIVNEKLFKKDQKTGQWIPKFKVGVGLME
jgi:hypothetical protein